MKKRLQALRPHYCDGRDRVTGEIYEIDEVFVPLLLATASAKILPDAEAPQPPKTAPAPPPLPSPKARTISEAESFTRYRRRDMKAEK